MEKEGKAEEKKILRKQWNVRKRVNWIKAYWGKNEMDSEPGEKGSY